MAKKNVEETVEAVEKVATDVVTEVKSWSKTVWKYIGIGLVVAGTAVLALTGVASGSITAIVIGVCSLVGLIVALINA